MSSPIKALAFWSSVLLAYLVVASVIAITAVGFAYADGVDEPPASLVPNRQPNFYQDFDRNPCAYDLGIQPVNCVNGQLRPEPCFLVPDFVTPYRLEPVQKPVPEPEQLALLGLGLTALAAKLTLFK